MKLLQRFSFCALMIGLLLVAPTTGPAQTFTWHNEKLIENNAGFDGYGPQVALSGNTVVAVWEQLDGNFNSRIYSNYSTDGGATWHSDQTINSAGFDGYDPQVALSGSTAVAVWQQKVGGKYRIYSNYSTDGGATWHSNQLIENNAGFDGYDPQVALSGSIAVAVWRQSDGSSDPIYSNYSTDGGATWHSDQLIENNTGFAGYDPQVALSGSTAVAVWGQWDGSNWRIYSNYSTDGGATWHSDQLIEYNAGFNGYNQQVALSGNTAVAVWRQSDGSNDRIYSNYSTDGGATWHSDQLIENNAGGGGVYPQVALSGNNAVAVWMQGDGSKYRIYSNYSTDGGATWHSDQLIADNASFDGYYPQVALSGSTAVVVWEQYDGSGDVRISLNYSTDGGATWHSEQSINSGLADGYEPQVALSGSTAVAVWRQSGGGSWRIYSNYGTLAFPTTVTVSATVASAQEAGPTPGQFTVSRTGSTSSPLTVAFSVSGTATQGSDYFPIGTTNLVIPAGSSSATITLTPIDDTAIEGLESVVITLSASANYVVGTPNSATVTITSDDLLPTVTVLATTASALEAGPTPGQFTVSRTGSTSSLLTVAFSVSGSATPGSDYFPIVTNLVIPAGSSSLTITVMPIDDTAIEGLESVVATLSASANYAVGTPNSATVTITSNDGLWAGAVDLGGGWKWLSWFGYFWDAGDGWIYHNEHQWMYAYGTTTSDIWFWTADMGWWLWTNDVIYPYLYRANDGVWLYYLVGSSGPRWFYNFTTGSWESH